MSSFVAFNDYVINIDKIICISKTKDRITITLDEGHEIEIKTDNDIIYNQLVGSLPGARF